MRRLRVWLRARWPHVLAAVATGAYAVAILGFGLNYRPLHNDEGVTLYVATRPSALDVLRTAVDDRHGPPLHYLLVHASLVWRTDMLGLRLPSALLGILAVALAYGCGRELLGNAGGALVAVVTAACPLVVHLAQFARGYTALIALSYLSLWLAVVLARRRTAWLAAAYAVSALLLASAHPFGLFAVASELVLLVLLTAPSARTRSWRRLAPAGAAVALGLVALLLLHHVYAPLEHKYGVGRGGSVVDVTSRRLWDPLAGQGSGTSAVAFWVVLGLAVAGGVAALAVRNRRAAVVAVVWLALPLALLSVLRASSSDFAPERHLAFLVPGYALALAGGAQALAALVRRGLVGALAAAAALAALLAPAVLADYNDLSAFNADLRDASLYMSAHFRDGDVMLVSTGENEPNTDARLYGAYAVLEAGAGSPLARWNKLTNLQPCAIVDRLADQPAHDGGAQVWLLMRPGDSDRVVAALSAVPRAHAHAFGDFVVADRTLPRWSVVGALEAGVALWRAAYHAAPAVHQIRWTARRYAQAMRLARDGGCAAGTPAM